MKPGLYVATVNGWAGDVGTVIWIADDEHAVFFDRDGELCDVRPWSFAADARPLVVLDPDSEDDCRRLMEAALAHRSATIPTLETIRGILRALADPKPPEPTGLGAVVRAAGDKWTRGVRYSAQPWTDGQTWRAWADLDVTEVLSEGVAL